MIRSLGFVCLGDLAQRELTPAESRRALELTLYISNLEHAGDVIHLNLSDRIAVLYEGKIMGVFATADVTVADIGLMMAGSLPDADKNSVMDPTGGQAH